MRIGCNRRCHAEDLAAIKGKASDPVFFNRYSDYEGIYVFTPIYGSSDRIEKPHLCAVVRNGKVTDMVSANEPVSIPSDRFLVSAVRLMPKGVLRVLSPSARRLK